MSLIHDKIATEMKQSTEQDVATLEFGSLVLRVTRHREID